MNILITTHKKIPVLLNSTCFDAVFTAEGQNVTCIKNRYGKREGGDWRAVLQGVLETQNVRQRPVSLGALRPGSLYAVKRKGGFEVTRLRKVAHDDYSVFQTHAERPFLARFKQVFLANPSEVEAYLETATLSVVSKSIK